MVLSRANSLGDVRHSSALVPSSIKQAWRPWPVPPHGLAVEQTQHLEMVTAAAHPRKPTERRPERSWEGPGCAHPPGWGANLYHGKC